MLDILVREAIAFIAVKELTRIEGHQGVQTKGMSSLHELLLATVERDLISERSRQGLTRAGSRAVSSLDG